MSNNEGNQKARSGWSILIRLVGGALATLFAIIVLMMIWMWPFITSHGFKGEKWAKRVVTGDELQTWALKVLADPENKALQTNYPAQLQNMCRNDPPHVMVVDNTNYPPAYVAVLWGHVDWMAGFQIGPTNFVSSAGLERHEWQPGVYWFFDH